VLRKNSIRPHHGNEEPPPHPVRTEIIEAGTERLVSRSGGKSTRGAGDMVRSGEKVHFNFLSPIMGRRWLLTLKERAEGLAASKLPIPLRKATS
jgi:hypothetical protein